ncbi:uncharacterized protein LOC142628636 [Castanea sativa]|uniref:uncharacterized protein LOC142628636 n=1 Tax=Castanea sativa TaxID=21020 RepID=UPI003F64C34C
MDPWVPWLPDFIPKPHQAAYADCPMMVSMLIDNTNHWRVGLINEIFKPASAQAILALPIPQRRKPDKLIWIPDAKGAFSVKSVYKANHIFNITTTLNEAQWKGLWKIKTTERIRILLWRMATNSLPTKDILNQRFETFNSSWVQNGFSKCTEQRWHNQAHPSTTTSEVESWYVSSAMTFVVDGIWNLRNRAVFQGEKVNIREACLPIQSRIIEFHNVIQAANQDHCAPTSQVWKPPLTGFIKLNVDAAIGPLRTALAVVARNSLGEVIKVWAKPHHSCTPIQAEASAIQWAANLASSEGWKQVIIESDSKMCMDSLSDNPAVPYWAISNDIVNILNSVSVFLSCSFV